MRVVSASEGLAGSRVLADAAMLSTIVAIVLLVGVSQISLEALGYAYIKSGGSFWEKVHPATPFALLALLLRCAASNRSVATAKRIVTNDGGVVLFMIAVAMAALSGLTLSRTPVTPLVDTFLLPVACFWLLRDLDERMIRLIALIIATIFAANAVIALAEYFTSWRLVPITVPDGASADPLRNDFDWRASLAADWRATALLGHPIESGALVGAFILCLAARGCRWLPASIRGPLLILQILSLFAYGSRLALVLAVALVLARALFAGFEAVKRGWRMSPRGIALSALALPLLLGSIGLALQFGLFDRTFARFTNDEGSASTRLTMFRLFDPLSFHDLVFAPDQDVVQTWKRLEGLEYGIESSWIGLAVTYGLVVAGILCAGLLAFARSVVRVAGRGAWMVEAFFFAAVSLATGLAGKTTTLATVTVLVLVFIRRDERVWSDVRACRWTKTFETHNP